MGKNYLALSIWVTHNSADCPLFLYLEKRPLSTHPLPSPYIPILQNGIAAFPAHLPPQLTCLNVYN